MDGAVRRLIETDEFPIGVISQHSRRDQNVRKGHLHTLHVWWATRPLAACRAVLMATLLPDPVDERCPETFRQGAREALSWYSSRDLSDPMALRQALLKFIGEFADWDASVEPRWVESSRKLVAAAHPEGPPLVADPFAGIGSIPFEALRVGADAFAGDLNPVAVLLLKTALEYIPTYGTRLAEAVRKWGGWIREKAGTELREFYPTEPDGSIPLAYLWARTIRCEAPGCGAEVPLVGLLWLSRKEKQRVALRYWGDKAAKQVKFEIFRPQREDEVQPPIVRRFVATCPVCGYTTPYKRVREQLRAKGGGIRDARMIAVITLKPDLPAPASGRQAGGTRSFRLATARDVEVARKAAQALEHLIAEHRAMPVGRQGPFPLVPDEPLPPDGALGFRVQKYGMTTWGDLFSPRQALALATFARLVRQAHQEVLGETCLPDRQAGDAGFARAVATCLGLAVSNLSQYLCATAFYIPEYIRSPFYGSAFPMKADFADVNPLLPRLIGPTYDSSLISIQEVLSEQAHRLGRVGTPNQGSATAIPLPDQAVPYVVTDPPYYDAVPYADLSDFCYVWLKRMVGELHPDLFRWPLTPKGEECIMDPGPPRPGEPEKTKQFFESTMQKALAECKRVLQPDGVAVVLFAHKGTAGWEALLNALIQAGWTVTSSWPIETERGARMRAKNSAVLASSVFLVCRPRPTDVGVGDWREVLTGLNQKVADWLPRLAQEGIQGADAIFSCLGPALEVYSRYERVETAGGQAIPLGDVRNGKGEIVQRGYLSFVWEVVAREALKVIFAEADPAGFEEDARLTAMWLWTLRARTNGATVAGEPEEALLGDEEEEETAAGKAPKGYALPYDDARLIIQGLGAHEEQLKRPGGVLEVRGDKARLLSAGERRRFLTGRAEPAGQRPRRGRKAQLAFEEMVPEPEEAASIKPGDTTLDRLHQAMLLFADGRSEALRRFLVDDGAGRDERFWRLANALSALYPPASQEKRWVDGVLARKRGLGL